MLDKFNFCNFDRFVNFFLKVILVGLLIFRDCNDINFEKMLFFIIVFLN